MPEMVARLSMDLDRIQRPPLTSPSPPRRSQRPKTAPGAPNRLSTLAMSFLRSSRSRSRPTTPNTRSRPPTPALELSPVIPQLIPQLLEPALEITLTSDVLVLKGTGSDIEPAVLSGTVVLLLPEATTLKDIQLVLTAKARVSPSVRDSSRQQHQSTLLFTHEWDLLEGDKSHHHTLKAGRHEFPFQLELGSDAPSSLSACAGAHSISWKLRATAVRPTLSTNFVAVKPLTIIRSFTNEALEYQQTLDIENTWPDKIMYAMILPHKAWASGDTLSALLKFSPLAKGVKVVSIRMMIQSKVRTVWKTMEQEEVHIVASTKQVMPQQASRRRPPPRVLSPVLPSPEPERSGANNNVAADRIRRKSFFKRWSSRALSRENSPLFPFFRPKCKPPSNVEEPPDSSPTSLTSSASIDSRRASLSQSQEDTSELETMVRLPIPTHATPSSNIHPIVVSHRVKWDVLLLNLDGHHSELRCSLPIHILAKEVLEDARAATSATRAALFGADYESAPVQEVVLPAYHDHVRDRVAVAELHSSLLAKNPLASGSGTPEDELQPMQLLSSSYGPSSSIQENTAANTSGMASASTTSLSGGLPSELLVSLGRMPATTQQPDATTTPAEGRSREGSRGSSRASSRNASPSRAAAAGELSSAGASSSTTPVPTTRGGKHGKFVLKPFTPFSRTNKSSSAISTSRPPSSASNSFFSMSRPSTRPSSPIGEISPLPSAASTSTSAGRPSTSPPASLRPALLRTNSKRPSSSRSSQRTSSIRSQPPVPVLPREHFYDAIPDYAMAARGFLGGGITPLSMLAGLPSYDDAQRSSRSRFSTPGVSTNGSFSPLATQTSAVTN